jgi:anti-anti-sigma factor
VLRPGGAVVVIALQGEVDLANCAELHAVMRQVAADPTARQVIVDLTGVAFLAGCGVRCLARLQARLAARRARMQLVVSRDAGSLRRVLVLLDGFEIVDSLVETGALC